MAGFSEKPENLSEAPQGLRNNIIDFKAAFEAMPGYSALLGTDVPRYTILATTYDYLQPSGKKKADVIGKGLFEVFPP